MSKWLSSLIIQSVYVILFYFLIPPWLKREMAAEMSLLIHLFDLVGY